MADQASLDQYYHKDELKITLDDSCQIYCYEGADPERRAEDMDREIETRDSITQLMISNNKQGKSKIISLKEVETD